jgi:hypothetical protein
MSGHPVPRALKNWIPHETHHPHHPHLVIIGGIHWLLVGAFDFNLVGAILQGDMSPASGRIRHRGPLRALADYAVPAFVQQRRTGSRARPLLAGLMRAG